jgi:hypothetical protein
VKAELMPYSPEVAAHQEFAEAEMLELNRIRRSGLEIVTWWLRSSNTIRMQLIEEGFDDREFSVPNDQVLEAHDHPNYYASLQGKNRSITRPYEGEA